MTNGTNGELEENWRKYGVEIGGKVHPLKDKFVMCWGWHDGWGGLLFDVGDWSGESYSFIAKDDNLIAVNPENHTETRLMGKLVLLEG